MKYINEYRDRQLVDKMVAAIVGVSRQPIRIMEVCGGHTMAIRKYGIQRLLPEHVALLSGPGCPVCVTDREAIDRAIQLTRIPGMIVTTYGDLIRVPGSRTSLNEEKARGADIRIVYSTLEALAIARDNPDRKVAFIGIGFETTTPSSAVALLEATQQKIPNFYLLSLHKIMPPAMAALIDQGINIDGYIGPGHVTTIAGARMYRPLVEEYRISVVVSGFEPVDILQSIYRLVVMKEEGRFGTEIQYKRAVTDEGNARARELVERFFTPATDSWRGLGPITDSGLMIRQEYRHLDAAVQFDLKVDPVQEPKGCICGEVLRGLKSPVDCALFDKTCTPANPVGACMVSGEGACQAYFNYR